MAKNTLQYAERGRCSFIGPVYFFGLIFWFCIMVFLKKKKSVEFYSNQSFSDPSFSHSVVYKKVLSCISRLKRSSK